MSRIEVLLEKLDDCENATSFLQVSNKIINLKLKALLPMTFVQDEFVAENAVTPLLKEGGPLITSDVISKLMFAMGTISVKTYSDVGLFIQTLDYALMQPEKISYCDDVIYDFIQSLMVLNSQQNNFHLESIKRLKFGSFETYSRAKYEALVKIVLTLSCEMLVEKLEKNIHQ